MHLVSFFLMSCGTLGALELLGVRVDHGVVAGAEVAGVLSGARGHAAAVVAADVAHLVAHLVLPVVGAPHHARRRAVYLWRSLLEQGSAGAPELLLHLQLL